MQNGKWPWNGTIQSLRYLDHHSGAIGVPKLAIIAIDLLTSKIFNNTSLSRVFPVLKHMPSLSEAPNNICQTQEHAGISVGRDVYYSTLAACLQAREGEVVRGLTLTSIPVRAFCHRWQARLKTPTQCQAVSFGLGKQRQFSVASMQGIESGLERE